MTEFTDKYEEQMDAALRRMDRRFVYLMLTDRQRLLYEPMKCKKCGGRVSVQQRDYYDGHPSCDNCGYYPTMDELEAHSKPYREESEQIDKEMDAWFNEGGKGA